MLSGEELAAFAQGLWCYELTVNGAAVPSGGKVIIDTGDFTIASVERRSPYLHLPEEYFEAGRLQSGYRLSFPDMQPAKVDGRDGTVVSAVEYTFIGVPNRSEVSFTVDNGLRESLGLTTDTVTITVRQ